MSVDNSITQTARRTAPTLLGTAALAAWIAACSSGGATNVQGSGGSPASGGSLGAVGGGLAAGGSAASGGGASVGGGGAVVGGAASAGGTGAGGGVAAGGQEASGGSNSGGSSSGGSDTGSGGGVLPSGVAVNLAAVHQTIQGFGLNSALMKDDKTLPINDLFGTEGPNAIGLSILRVGMKPDGTLTGKYVSEARAKGAKIIGSTWSPPPECKSNKSTENGGHLLKMSNDGKNTDCFALWSKRIADFAAAQDLYAMSIANESDFASCPGVPVCTVAYDTTVYTANEMVAWVKVAGAALKAKGIKVIAPEASEWIHAWSNLSSTGSQVASHPHSSDALGCGCFSNDMNDTAALADCDAKCTKGDGYDYGHWLWNDQDAWKSFDIFGVHEYDSQIAYAWPSDVNQGVKDKEIWQTEMSGVKFWPEQGPTKDIANGVAVAGWIHSAMTVGEASAWLYWWYEAYYENDNEGLALLNDGTGPAMRYYTLGNYSKFVRPGFVAVEVVGNTNKDVLLSAYKGPAGEVVVVAINKGSAAVTMPIAIAGGEAPATLTPTLTAGTADKLKDGTPVQVTGGSFMAALPGTSVTTFSGKL